MKKIVFLVLLLSIWPSSFVMAQQTGLVPPPPINVPYGGVITNDLNISESNVLGTIKQLIPAFSDIAKKIILHNLPPVSKHKDNGPEAQNLEVVIKNIDVQPLADSLAGLKGFRVLIVKYPGKMNSVDFFNQFNKGVAKLGKFNKVYSGWPDASIGATLGLEGKLTIALYAQEEGDGGYIGAIFDPYSRDALMFRFVGVVDVVKLVNWAKDIISEVIPKINLMDGAPSNIQDGCKGEDTIDDKAPDVPKCNSAN